MAEDDLSRDSYLFLRAGAARIEQHHQTIKIMQDRIDELEHSSSETKPEPWIEATKKEGGRFILTVTDKSTPTPKFED